MSEPRIRNQMWLGLLVKALRNMSPLSMSGELRFVTQLLADAIYEDLLSAHRCNTEPLRQTFFRAGGCFYGYCDLIGLDGDQVKNMAVESWGCVTVDK